MDIVAWIFSQLNDEMTAYMVPLQLSHCSDSRRLKKMDKSFQFATGRHLPVLFDKPHAA